MDAPCISISDSLPKSLDTSTCPQTKLIGLQGLSGHNNHHSTKVWNILVEAEFDDELSALMLDLTDGS
uniref:Ovule protein n=1 Tax=Ascaris lumbricoides TaxID=6252 RepID=A0A0M3IBV7_ASCLU